MLNRRRGGGFVKAASIYLPYFCSNAVRTYDDDDLRALIVAAALIK